MELKLTDKQLKNFWKKVDKNGEDGCWIWTAVKNKGGYGLFRLNDKLESAHRVSYLIFYGEFPKDFACHTCDNQACVNPNHLFNGTNEDNMKDKVAKNRQAKGGKNGMSKLTEEQVLEIRRNYKKISYGKSNSKELSEKYGVSQRLITGIILRKRWTHI